MGTVCWYRKVHIVNIPPTQQTLTAAADHHRLHSECATKLCAYQYNFSPHGVEDSHHDSSITYLSAEDTFCHIHASNICDDGLADLALSDSLDTFHHISGCNLERVSCEVFVSAHDWAMLGCSLAPDLWRPRDGVLCMALGYSASIGLLALGLSSYHHQVVSCHSLFVFIPV